MTEHGEDFGEGPSVADVPSRKAIFNNSSESSQCSSSTSSPTPSEEVRRIRRDFHRGMRFSFDKDTDEEDEQELEENGKGLFEKSSRRRESRVDFIERQYHNVVHFFVEDWFLSAMLGVITAVLSITSDVGIELLQHFRLTAFEFVAEYNKWAAFGVWIMYITVCVGAASCFCKFVGPQAVGSGIPELKVIMHGFSMKNYLTFRTLVAKVFGLVFTLGGGLPVGKEGPFVHMGAIVASLLTRATAACRYNAFFSNEGRQMEMLSSGCAVGIACTFSAPAGGVLYGIESTSKYFAVKNYWRSFFATTCSAIIFRFAMTAIVPQKIAGTITAYYQTNFPNEVFLIEEIPFFVLLGILSGLLGALFVLLHRKLVQLKKSRLYQALFAQRPVIFTSLCACLVGVITYPYGFGEFIAGKLTFRETLADFVANCTFSQTNISALGCPDSMIRHWMGHDRQLHPAFTLACYIVVYFVLVAHCVSLYVPSGIFVPSFVIGACGGRLMGELVSMWFPEGIRGPENPQIYPGLYAVVGAAAYTGAVTHSLSIAVIVCETTGQLCALLPVLIALMVANAISSFLQPSIYESIIMLKDYPYLTDLPPSRVSVHTMKVSRVMVRDLFYITRQTTYRELQEILKQSAHLRSYPLVTDKEWMFLLGSVSRKYLCFALSQAIGPDPSLLLKKQRTATDLLHSTISSLRTTAPSLLAMPFLLTDRHFSGDTLLANSPLHESNEKQGAFASLLHIHHDSEHPVTQSERNALLDSRVELADTAIDAAPFQLVKSTTLLKVHTLFSLLALHHAYVTERGRLVGVVSLKELRETFANIYTLGAQPPRRKRAMQMTVNYSTDNNTPHCFTSDTCNVTPKITVSVQSPSPPPPSVDVQD